jgi:hypothetical protein
MARRPLIRPGRLQRVPLRSAAAMLVVTLAASACARQASPEPVGHIGAAPAPALPRLPRADTLAPTEAAGMAPAQPALERAMAAAIGWLSREIVTSWPADAAAILAYLGRAYEAPGLDALAGSAVAAFDAEAAERQGLPRAYHRLFGLDPPLAVDELHTLPGLTAAVTAQALHCDRRPLAPGYRRALRRMADHGGYGLTHAVLALGWIAENGCDAGLDSQADADADADARRAAALRDDCTQALGAILDDPRAPTDLKAETMAMLHYASQGARILPRHLRALLAAQRADGSWAALPGGDRGHPHTTALALWALLGLATDRPAAAPMIPGANRR